jgi:hypothetical protein
MLDRHATHLKIFFLAERYKSTPLRAIYLAFGLMGVTNEPVDLDI